MEPTEHERAPETQEDAASETHHAAADAAGSKNRPKQDVPTEPVAPKRKPKPSVEILPAEAPSAEAPAEMRAETTEQQHALRTLER